MRSEGRLLGFLGFDQLGADMTWSDEALRLLRMVGNMLGNAVTRIAAEQALMAANDALEQKVAERTRALQAQQARLVQSEKMASLGQLVAGVAHEINTPLGALLSGARTSRRTLARIEGRTMAASDDDLRRWVSSAGLLADTVAEAGGRIDEVVTSFRRFARLDRSSVAELDLALALEDALTLVVARLPKGVRVNRRFEEGLAPVRCRAADVNQLLLNILLNACDAVDVDGTILLRLRAVEDGVCIEIEDDGPGISPDVLPKIYDPGFTTKGVGAGAGFGLAIAHQVAEDHQGWIRAERSSLGGAAFIVWLPRLPDGLSADRTRGSQPYRALTATE